MTDGIIRRSFGWGRGILAVLAGVVTVVALSNGADALMRVLGVFPPAGWPMDGTGQFVLATGYRTLFNVAGGYATARLSPMPFRTTWVIVLAAIGTLLSLGGVYAAIVFDLKPFWYPVALVVLAFPSTWLGGWLGRRRAG